MINSSEAASEFQSADRGSCESLDTVSKIESTVLRDRWNSAAISSPNGRSPDSYLRQDSQ